MEKLLLGSLRNEFEGNIPYGQYVFLSEASLRFEDYLYQIIQNILKFDNNNMADKF